MNDFSREDIESLKASVDLAELMRVHGIELKPVGRNFTALCPWHDDKEASLVVNPAKQLYNCFGCDAKGDALTFLQAQEHLTFPQAVMRLRELPGDVSSDDSEPSAPVKSKTSCNPQLLKRVADHYAQGLAKSEEAREYLKGRSWLASTTFTEIRQLHLPILVPELRTDFWNGENPGGPQDRVGSHHPRS